MSKRIKVVVLGLAALAQAGCASSPGSIEARYVSPTTYQNWTCPQLFDEKMRLATEVERVSGLQRENANADAALMTVGLVIFWPALFGLAATKDRKDELGRLKGEYEAVDNNITAKQCSLPAPGAPSTASAPNVAAAPAVALSGTYTGKGVTESYCQTPTLSLSIAGSTVSGTLSEVASGSATGTVTGTVEGSGQMVLTVKSSNPAFVSGTYRGAANATMLTVEMKQPSPNDCHYKFSLAKK